MRELAILSFQTLDGVMQAPRFPDEDQSSGFYNGGWGAPYWDEVMTQVLQYAMAEPYDILFGRTTYQLFSRHWPGVTQENPVARIMNGSRKYVATHSLTSLDWENSEIVSGDVPAEIAALKSSAGPLIQVHGSAGLIQTLLAHDLIDEYRIWTFPVLAGKGKRLFEDVDRLKTLSLIRSEATSNGVVMGIYRKSA